MENVKDSNLENPPRLIASITEGFNVVANRIYLILFPLLLDTFLWLGPHVRLKTLLGPFITEITGEMSQMATPEILEMTKWGNELWDILLDHFNLFSLVHVFPIGIPSLMSGLSPIKTPYGSPTLLEVGSFFQVLLMWFSLTIIGIVLGGLYFDAISRATDEKKALFSITDTGSSILQIFVFTLLCFLFIVLFSIPILMMVTLLSLISPSLGQIALLFIFLVVIWFIMPLVFSAHGVFVSRTPIYSSIGTSIRLVRNYLPGTGMFILTSLLLYQGLNLLWETAPDSSWMSFVGIFGHAFISTGLIASSFVYYRKGIAWMESKIHANAVQS
ncbi:MAG: hypothetical protein GYA15_13245 [Leptolinea sp.]|jgi:hypothetical protein|nr:hypothetical protein [Leptolinea sp.]